MADTDTPITFTKSAGQRIADAVKAVEAMPRKVIGRVRDYLPSPDPEFWAKITDSQAISSDPADGFKYAWSEAMRTAGGFMEVSGGVAGGFTDVDYSYALSQAEINGVSIGPLENGTWVLIRYSGDDSGKTRQTIIDTASACKTDDEVTIGAASEPDGTAPDAATWDRDVVTSGTDYGQCPVKLYVQTGTAYDDAATTPTLYALMRPLTFDACGKLMTIGAEEAYAVDVPEECDPAPEE